MLCILFATKKWRQYLFGREFIIRTDHKPLKYLLEQRLYTEAQHTWLLKLCNYKYTMEYKRGKENVAADSLSRRGEEGEAITDVSDGYCYRIRLGGETDEYFQKLNSQWEASQLDPNVYQRKGGISFYKGRILISPTDPLTQMLLSEHHDTHAGGILGMRRPYIS